MPEEFSEFIKRLGRQSLKAGSKETPDIWLDLPDSRNNSGKPLGFSIKSIMGSPPTIFNCSAATNFLFEITGVESKGQIDEIERHVKHFTDKKKGIEYDYADYSLRIEKFKEYGLGLKYVSTCKISNVSGVPKIIEDKVFERNLKMVDSRMPELVGFMVAESYFNHISKIPEIVGLLNKKDPLEEHPSAEYPFYFKKINDLLVAMTLSMTGATPWDGTEGTNGGLIIVKENGDIVCYHIFDRNDFREFLFKHAMLDTPSNARQLSMSIIPMDSKYYLPLGFQVRLSSFKDSGRRKKSKDAAIKGYYDIFNGRFTETGDNTLDMYSR